MPQTTSPEPLDNTKSNQAAECLRDVVALSTLPAVWLGAEPLRIAESLAAALFTTLDPEFVYVSLEECAGTPPVAVAQTDRSQTDPLLAKKIGCCILEWARTHDPDELMVIPHPLGRGILRIATRPLGFDAYYGVVAAGVLDECGPAPFHQTLLNIAATQATVAVQNARLLRSLRKNIVEREKSEAQSKLDAEALRKQTELLKTLTTNAFSALCLLDSTGCLTFVNPAFERMTGYTPSEAIGKNAHDLLHFQHPDGRLFPVEDCNLMKACREGHSLSNYETHFVRKDRTLFPIICSACRLEENGRFIGALVEFRDTTEIKRTERSLEQRTRTLESLNKVSGKLVAELNLENIVQSVVDAGREVSGAAFGAFFYNTTNPDGEAYMLYTLSGAPREAFEKFGMPRATPMFGPTFRGEGIVRVADVTRHSNYGKVPPHHGMPKGHLPVRSYLAVPVTSRSGAVLGGLFFGHPDPDVFTEEAEKLVAGLAAQAAIAIDNANLYQALQRKLEQHKKAEEALRQSEAQLRLLANAIPQLAWTAHPDGWIYWYNRRWFEYTGTTPEQMEGWGWQSVHDPKTLPSVLERWKTSIATGEPFNMIFPIRGSDGVLRPFLTRVMPLKDETGRVLQWFGTNTDVSEEQRATEKLEQMVEERTAKLRETIGELEAFSYSIAHDMRAPLRAMQSFAQLLKQDCENAVSEEGKDFLRRIITSANRMDRLIQDVLTYSRVARAEVALAPVDLNSLLQGIIESYPHLQAPKVLITIEHSLPTVMGNEASLTQCFSNLLGNAAKFVPAGVTPAINIRAESRSSRARIWIEDNGIGIPPDQHERIFGIFQRLHQRYEGTGIGLSIVKKAVERMGGTIGLESSPGLGSKFWIELPSAMNT